MICKECGAIHDTTNEHFCPVCRVKYQKRKEFRIIMAELDEINKMDSRERNYLSGFSYAELERFSLIMKQLMKANHFPRDDNEFVNASAKEKLEYLRNTIFF